MQPATIRSWIRGLFRRGRLERDLQDEIRSHLDARVADLVRGGVAPPAAERQARVEFGSIERVKDQVRDARGVGMIDAIRGDLSTGLRSLGRARTFTIVATVSLALGIGANTLVFSVLNAALLTPPALPDPDRVVILWNVADASKPDQLGTSSISRYQALQRFSRSFESIGAYNGVACGIRTLGDEERGAAPERLLGQTISPSLFRTLGVAPALGRTFTDAEDVVDQVAPVVLLTHRSWQRRFAADPQIVGRRLMIDRTPTTVIGVLAPEFDFFGSQIEFIAPLCLTRAQVESRVGGNTVVGRLKPGVTIADAQRELDLLSARLAVDDPVHHRGVATRVESVQRARARLLSAVGQAFNDYGKALLILQACVGFVLLIACANVAGLLLARSAARQHEVTVRVALGAWRGRIVRQLVTENVPLVTLGAAAGVALAWIGLKAFVAAAPPDFPRLGEIALDVRVLAFTAVLALLSNLLFTLVPAWKASGTSCVDGLQSTSRHATDSVRRQRLRSTLVAVQIAVAVVLLTGAGLLIRSFTSALANNLGADTSHVLTFDFRYPPREAFKQIGMHGTSGLFEVSAKPADMVDRVSERLRHVAGVEAVGAVSLAPFSGPGIQMPFSIEGRTLDTGAASTADSLPVVEYFAVTPGFFGTMRVPLRQGRDFVPTDDERSRSVVIVNETFARQYFRGEEAIGRYLRLHFLPEEPVREVVGVVADVLSGRMESQRSPTVYVPNRQQSSRFVGPYVYTRNGMYFVVRTTADPGATIEIVKRAVAEVDPVTPVANARPVEQTLDDQVRFLRLYTLLLSAFGGVAALLAAVGIYGVAACVVAQRTREFGVRVALGARRRDVLMLVVKYAARVIVIGAAVGLAAAVSGSHAIRALLFGVTPTDPFTYVVVLLTVMAVSVTACLLPARRASGVNPASALRQE